MEFSKRNLKNLLEEIVNELPIEEGEDSNSLGLSKAEISEDEKAHFKQIIVEGLYSSRSVFIWKNDLVPCSLQNNYKVINKYNSVQCTSCKRYYCDDHNLSNCPRCGHLI